MAPEAQSFVFIDEDQQKKYSRSTISAINAQVAKFSHKQRRSVIKPHSAPSSPPTIGTTDGDAPVQDLSVGHGTIQKRVRSTSESGISGASQKSSSLQMTHSRTKGFSPKLRKNSSVSDRSTIESRKTINYTEAVQESAETSAEDITQLFQRLCRISHCPSYQAFPFFLNIEERRLAHYWFTEVLKDDFGMKLQLEDTFQGNLAHYALAFQVPLRWVIARAADELHKTTGSQSLTTVYRSREKAFASLQEILYDANTPTDEAIGSIQQSIVHNPEFRKTHLRGMDAMIVARGGLEQVVRDSQVTCADHLFLQYTFAEYDISTFDELTSLSSIFVEALLAIQSDAQEYSGMVQQMEFWASSVDLADCTSPDNDTSTQPSNLEKWAYALQRTRLFAPNTALGQLIRKPFDPNAPYMRKSRLFAALFQLGSTLLEYKTIGEKALFLRRLESAVVVAANVDSETGITTMMEGTHIYVTGWVGRQLQQELHAGTNGEVDEKGIAVAVKGIAGLKVFGLLGDDVVGSLVRCLQGWLRGEAGDGGNVGDLWLQEENVDTLMQVIETSWVERQILEQGVLATSDMMESVNDLTASR